MPRDQLDFCLHNEFQELPISECLAEYVWIDGTGEGLRCKTKVLSKAPKDVSELPEWNFDGSSTAQAPGRDSEIMLRPAALYRDPFRKGNHVLVMCECYLPDGTPARYNFRHFVAPIFEAGMSLKPWYGIEQEYTLFGSKSRPLGWPEDGFPAPQGPYYCSAGADRAFGRYVAEAHMRACLFAGIRISGINGEVLPGQWEYQVGPVEGIAAADQLWMSRYIMQRVCEMFGVTVSFHPKPIMGDWNGSGAHHNFSTEAMRREGGFAEIQKAIERLGEKHREHIFVYGESNELRLTGKHETASMDKFSFGVANRGCSIRIPRSTEKDGCGYFEDRRPASNVDAYLSCGMLLATSCGLPGGERLGAALEASRRYREEH